MKSFEIKNFWKLNPALLLIFFIISNIASFWLNPYVGGLFGALYLLLWPLSITVALEGENRMEKILYVTALGVSLFIIILWFFSISIFSFNLSILTIGFLCAVYYLYFVTKVSLLMSNKARSPSAITFMGFLILNFYWPIFSVILQKYIKKNLHP